jgi:hypothetical protein
MCSQARRVVWWHCQVGRNRLAISPALGIGAATMDLQIRVRCLSIQDLVGRLRHGLFNGAAVLLLRSHVCLRLGRGKVGLAFLQMLDLARCVLCAHETAMQTADFVTFRGRVLVLKLGLTRSQ